MSFSPGHCPIPPMVSVYANTVGWVTEAVAGSWVASSTPASNIRYFPILLHSPCIARRVWWANGATTTGGATVQCGLYSSNGAREPSTRLFYGSATQGTATEVQFVDITDTSLPPGLYYFAMTVSTTTSTTLFSSTGVATISGGYTFQETGTTLPATATPVESTASNIYLCGFATTASP